MSNITTVTEFLLLGFSDIQEWQLIYTALFLLVYLAALMGNLIIFAVTALDRQFHTPMYFFLRNLSILDLGYISVTVPKSILNALTNINSISLLGCAAQVFLLLLFAGSELALLMVMSHDRYVAICRPLHYEITMPQGACLLRFTCSTDHVQEDRVFFTCLPHLVIVTLFVTSGTSAYLKPISDSPSALDQLVSVFYALAAHDNFQTISNITTVTDFFLLGFSNIQELRLIQNIFTLAPRFMMLS
ncbi:putative olfactory receptor 14L1 [Tachyglossus aculeatus]|uniref:putative olfactory receptor 14L1 n=1 Tax=Tachyglossus aculeatus TaxID=9261 RepID=UPI0018F70FA2|nr:putative olfactory receptor 14L1 [Tachyglossus aculeatus]